MKLVARIVQAAGQRSGNKGQQLQDKVERMTEVNDFSLKQFTHQALRAIGEKMGDHVEKIQDYFGRRDIGRADIGKMVDTASHKHRLTMYEVQQAWEDIQMHMIDRPYYNSHKQRGEDVSSLSCASSFYDREETEPPQLIVPRIRNSAEVELSEPLIKPEYRPQKKQPGQDKPLIRQHRPELESNEEDGEKPKAASVQKQAIIQPVSYTKDAPKIQVQKVQERQPATEQNQQALPGPEQLEQQGLKYQPQALKQHKPKTPDDFTDSNIMEAGPVPPLQREREVRKSQQIRKREDPPPFLAQSKEQKPKIPHIPSAVHKNIVIVRAESQGEEPVKKDIVADLEERRRVRQKKQRQQSSKKINFRSRVLKLSPIEEEKQRARKIKQAEEKMASAVEFVLGLGSAPVSGKKRAAEVGEWRQSKLDSKNSLIFQSRSPGIHSNSVHRGMNMWDSVENRGKFMSDRKQEVKLPRLKKYELEKPVQFNIYHVKQKRAEEFNLQM